jgi:hypothetical protein
MVRSLSISAISLVVYIAFTIPTVLTLNNLINKAQEARLDAQRADINALKAQVMELEKRLQP